MSFYSFCAGLSQVLSQMLPAILYMLSLGMGCHVTVGDLRRAAQNGAALSIYALCYYLLTPGLWLLILTLLEVPREYASVFLFVSNSPGGLFGNVLTLWSGGDVGLSVGLTIFGLLLSLLSWAPTARLWGSFFATGGFEVPLKVFMQQCLACVLPVALGILIRRLRPRWAYWLRKAVGWTVGVTILCFGVTFATVKLHVFRELPTSVWLMGAAGPPSMFVVYAVARFCPVFRDGRLAWGVPHEQALAIAYEFVVKNVGLVLVVAVVAFPEEESDKFVAVITSISLGLHLMYIVAWLLGRKARQAQSEALARCGGSLVSNEATPTAGAAAEVACAGGGARAAVPPLALPGAVGDGGAV